MEEENNKEQEKTVEEEVIAEQVKKQLEENAEESKEDSETKDEDYLNLTKDEVQEEKKFQEVANAAESLDTQTKTETPSEQVPDIEPAEQKETTSEETAEVPTETANVIKDQDLIFLQYQCGDEECEFKLWVNNAEKDIGEKLKCFRCGKKLMKKRRLFDVNIKQYKDYEEAK